MRMRTIYVNNLPRNLSENDIYKKFEKFGRITKIEVIKDHYTQESRGFCFITYEREKEAKRAIKKMDKKEIKRRFINVQTSNRGKRRRKTPGMFLGKEVE